VIVIEVVRLVGELTVTKVSEDSDVAVYSLALCQGDKLLVFDGPGVEIKCSTVDVQLNIASHYKTAVSEQIFKYSPRVDDFPLSQHRFWSTTQTKTQTQSQSQSQSQTQTQPKTQTQTKTKT
jgi:hypothetical protein